MKANPCGLDLRYDEPLFFVAGPTQLYGQMVSKSSPRRAPPSPFIEVLDEISSATDGCSGSGGAGQLAGIGSRDAQRMLRSELSRPSDPISDRTPIRRHTRKRATGFHWPRSTATKAEQGVPTTLVGLNIDASSEPLGKARWSNIKTKCWAK